MASFLADERSGPLPGLLLLLTIVTGLVDAVSYLGLGHVFVANMTGNVIFLGFAVADGEFSVPASLVAIAAFLVGALVGGRTGILLATHRGKLLTAAVAIESLLVAVAVVLTLTVTDVMLRYGLIVALGIAMGLQNAVARRLAVPDLTTTVLTLTLTGLAADSPIAGGKNPNPLRRVLATIAMFAGAAIGALLLLRYGLTTVLGLALALLIAALIGAASQIRATAAWTGT